MEVEDRLAVVSTLAEAKGSPALYVLLKRKVLRMYKRAQHKHIPHEAKEGNA